MDAAALLSAIVDSSDDAIVGKELNSNVLSWNAGAERIFGWSADEMVGQSIRRLIPDDRQDEEDRILACVGRGERVPNFETIRLRKDGSQVHVAVTVSPVRDPAGTIVAASKIARDITPTLGALEIRGANEERLRMMGDNLPVAAWIGDRKGILRWGNRMFQEFFGVTENTIAKFDWSNSIAPSARAEIAAIVRESVVTQGGWDAVMPMYGASGELRWFLASSVPVYDASRKLNLRFGTATDITAQREAENRVRTLLKEVNHRTRNMLATIQSMASRTAALGGDYIPRLESRIAALAATQDLLVENDWDKVQLEALVVAQFAAADLPVDRVAMTGPAILLSSGAADALGMAISEMAINAGLYGALSVAGGHVELDVSLTADDDEELLVIQWRERGGPTVAAPSVTGFGSRIIQDVPRGKLCGTVELSYDPAGFVWRLSCPARLALAQTHTV